ncbi:hypothetical protein COU12_00155 [Candidatus Jorgensenbacteria bacterium CG10_big_fil_rev_8_21_14_0_10_54_38]|uniref:Uncharacterized protein n=2 Tax=Candidatus Joergenseniibacteriota TaxID=1752739 RepID=A0A2M6WGN5_9BACT|nr:MAG: hypothetical protein COX26_00510 [Candidatus Jorgensenbacteria bacterium CG23_combo_of_CG06-09_8_20_14_all_54_14]PIT91973.1 MAG: hypothetical protein COU12_00155 [Candidatus Jorgensenbacteria bacterium CG10_big_fil_rev_8_21_14_0_10_54_38]
MRTNADYQTFLSNFDRAAPPEGLLDEVLLRIYGVQRRWTRVRTALFGFCAVAAGALLVPAWGALQNELALSGFTRFVSLAFSDWSTIITYGKDLGISLLESLPVFSAVAVLGLLLAFMASLGGLVRNAEAGRRSFTIKIT